MSLDAFGVAVEDLDRARDSTSISISPFPRTRKGTATPRSSWPSGIRLMFDTHETMKSFDPSWSPGTGSPTVTMAFSLGSPDEVDAKHDELVEAGGASHLAPWDAFWGMRYAVMRDPDGNELSLYASLPQSGD